MSLINYAIKIIVSFIKDLLYHIEIKQLEDKLQEEKEKAHEAREMSDSATADFRVKLEHYRKRKDLKLRSTIKRVRDSNRQAGGNDKSPSRGNAAAGQGDKGSVQKD